MTKYIKNATAFIPIMGPVKVLYREKKSVFAISVGDHELSVSEVNSRMQLRTAFEKEFKQFLESSRESVFDLLEFVCSHDRKEEQNETK